MAEHYLRTKRKDGQYRVAVKVEHQLTLREVALCVLYESPFAEKTLATHITVQCATKQGTMGLVKIALGKRSIDQLTSWMKGYGASLSEPYDTIFDHICNLWGIQRAIVQASEQFATGI